MHITVNHFKEYVNPENGCCTNSIEGKWNGIKVKIEIRRHNEQLLEDELMFLVWVHQNDNDVWGAFLNSIKNVQFDLPDEDND